MATRRAFLAGLAAASPNVDAPAMAEKVDWTIPSTMRLRLLDCPAKNPSQKAIVGPTPIGADVDDFPQASLPFSHAGIIEIETVERVCPLAIASAEHFGDRCRIHAFAVPDLAYARQFGFEGVVVKRINAVLAQDVEDLVCGYWHGASLVQSW